MPAATPLFAAVILAGGVTALVAIGMMILSLRRSQRLTVARGALSLALGAGVVAIASFGIAAVSAPPAQAIPDRSQTSVVQPSVVQPAIVQPPVVGTGTDSTGTDGPTNVQLPTE